MMDCHHESVTYQRKKLLFHNEMLQRVTSAADPIIDRGWLNNRAEQHINCQYFCLCQVFKAFSILTNTKLSTFEQL